MRETCLLRSDQQVKVRKILLTSKSGSISSNGTKQHATWPVCCFENFQPPAFEGPHDSNITFELHASNKGGAENMVISALHRRRMKAAFAAYTDAEMPRLRLDKPGLKLSQYKDLIWKSWQKSPSNPLNQQA